MPPIIGITVNRSTDSHGQEIASVTQAYLDAVVQAGGVPTLIPASLGDGGGQALYQRLDGILFSGGGDIAVEYSGGQEHPQVSGVEPLRDTLELSLLRAAVADGKPILGICRGCQLLNVGLGGTLYTHIADQLLGALKHDMPSNKRTFLAHTVMIEAETGLGAILGEPVLSVNSHHHQGLDAIGSGLRVAGRAPDGLVEAIEISGHPFGLAVQWHPEWLTNQPSMRNLFSRFVMAAGESQKCL